MKRMTDESFEDYRVRRTMANKAIKDHLKGSYFFISRQIFEVKDPETGVMRMVASPKGQTYTKEMQ